MRALIFLILSLWCFTIHCQNWNFEKPDYKEIKKNITEKSSAFYYPNLMDRFLEADSTLTIKEKRHLYYGHSFQENYAPYSSSNYKDSLQIVLRKQKHDTLEFKKIISFGDSILIKKPFEIRTMNYQLYALDKLDLMDKYRKKIAQFNILVEAILSSGNGITKKEAFYVIYTTHEYDLLQILGLTFGGEQNVTDTYDYLKLAEGETKVEGLYFDVTPCLQYTATLFE